MTIDSQIINYLKSDSEAFVSELLEKISVSRQMLHRVLNRMIEESLLEKICRQLKVFTDFRAIKI